MKRSITEKLITWKESTTRKPLIVIGPRMIGKTYSLREFGKNHYTKTIYCDFENNKLLTRIFEVDSNVRRIIKKISELMGIAITKNDTLIIFDEIGSCPKALNLLKKFTSLEPEIHIVASSSCNLNIIRNNHQLTFQDNDAHFIQMQPLDFGEFLRVTGNVLLLNHIQNSYLELTPVILPIHNKAFELYRIYLITGGYPCLVEYYIREGDLEELRIKQKSLSDAHIIDLVKHTTRANLNKSLDLYESIGIQLHSEFFEFQHSNIQNEIRAKEYLQAFEFLKATGAILESRRMRVLKPSGEIDTDPSAFKIYYSDIGFLTMQLSQSIDSIIQNTNITFRQYALIEENFVAQQLTANGFELHYWVSHTRNAHIPFIIKIGSSLIPVEIKTYIYDKSKNLRKYMDLFHPEYGIRITTENIKTAFNIRSIPIYATFCMK
ncbi:MAG: AAA family ATPase [Christensenellaceae bacterium]|nr:AAA family ATPase [Christensenellaceae bacterium]